MSAPERAVFLRLKSSTGVGAIAGDRIYPMRAPSTALGSDYITYQRISSVYSVTHSSGGPKYQRARVQVDCRSPDYDTASSLADSARDRLAGYRGSTGGVQVWGITLDSDRSFEEGEPGDDRHYRWSQDYMVEARVST